MFNKTLPYITSFLLGALLVALYVIKYIKPNIITDQYINSVEQSVKKMKQSGENNDQDFKNILSSPGDCENKKIRKPFLGIRLRKNKLKNR